MVRHGFFLTLFALRSSSEFCWSDHTLTYEVCCDLRVSPEGNPGCWSEDGVYTFQTCCHPFSSANSSIPPIPAHYQHWTILDFLISSNLIFSSRSGMHMHDFLVLFPRFCSINRMDRYSRPCDNLAVRLLSFHQFRGFRASFCDLEFMDVNRTVKDHAFCTALYLRAFQGAIFRFLSHTSSLEECTFAYRQAFNMDLGTEMARYGPKTGNIKELLRYHDASWWMLSRLRFCAILRQESLRKKILPKIKISAPSPINDPGRVAIIISANRDYLELPIAKLGVGMWSCYAQYHGYRLILDSNWSGYEHLGRTTPFHTQASQLAFISFAAGVPLAAELQSPLTIGWLKWIAPLKHLESGLFDLVVVADMDMIVNPACYQIGVHEIANSETGDFLFRDSPPFAETNGGFAMFRASENGINFLKMLLEKQSWHGLPLSDQDALAETILEFISLEKQRRVEEGLPVYKKEALHSGRTFPSIIPDRQLAYSAVFQTVRYKEELSNLIGPWMNRTSFVSRTSLIDPMRKWDVNYRVVEKTKNLFDGRLFPFIVHWGGSGFKVREFVKYVKAWYGLPISPSLTDRQWEDICQFLIVPNVNNASASRFPRCRPQGYEHSRSDCGNADMCG